MWLELEPDPPPGGDAIVCAAAEMRRNAPKYAEIQKSADFGDAEIRRNLVGFTRHTSRQSPAEPLHGSAESLQLYGKLDLLYDMLYGRLDMLYDMLYEKFGMLYDMPCGKLDMLYDMLYGKLDMPYDMLYGKADMPDDMLYGRLDMLYDML